MVSTYGCSAISGFEGGCVASLEPLCVPLDALGKFTWSPELIFADSFSEINGFKVALRGLFKCLETFTLRPKLVLAISCSQIGSFVRPRVAPGCTQI